MQNLQDYVNSVENHSVMNEFFDIKSNEHEPQVITEATINRILDKHSKAGFIVVSANRSDKDKKTNNDNAKKLIKMLKDSEYSYFPVYGGYHDKENNVKDSYELSFFVTNFKKQEEQEDFTPLKDLAIEICGKFDQDSVLVVEPNGKAKYIDRDGKVVGKQTSDTVSVNDLKKEFFTAIYKKNSGTNRMSYEMEFECYGNPTPCTLNERVRRMTNGEIIVC